MSLSTQAGVLNEDYYPGDVGFDPLGLKPTDPAEFAEMQTKELQNGRLAMLAAVGWPLGELFQPDLAAQWHAPSLVFAQGGENPSVLNGGLQNVPVVFWAGAVAVAFADVGDGEARERRGRVRQRDGGHAGALRVVQRDARVRDRLARGHAGDLLRPAVLATKLAWQSISAVGGAVFAEARDAYGPPPPT